MLSLNQAISQIEELLGISSDDTTVDERLIIDLLNQARAVALRQELNKARTPDDTIIQTLGCVPMEFVEGSHCPNVPVGCKILKSVCEIPDTIELHHTDGIISIGSPLITHNFFSYIPYSRVPLLGYNRFSKNLIYAFLLNNFLYIYSPGNSKFGLIESVAVRGIFEDPTKASKFKCNEGKPCFTYDDNYPISTWMYEAMVRPIVMQQLAVKLQMPIDTENNAADDKVRTLEGNPSPRKQRQQQTAQENEQE
jgi:hypothetical protein